MVGDIFQPTHLLFVLVVALLVLGPKRLPEVGRTLGAGIRDFRQAISGEAPDPPRQQNSEQVTSTTAATEDTSADATTYDVNWPEDSVEPPSFDEPAEHAAGEPGTAVLTNTQPATAVVTDSEPATEVVPEAPRTPDLDSLYFDAPADEGAETTSGDSAESHTDQPS